MDFWSFFSPQAVISRIDRKKGKKCLCFKISIELKISLDIHKDKKEKVLHGKVMKKWSFFHET